MRRVIVSHFICDNKNVVFLNFLSWLTGKSVLDSGPDYRWGKNGRLKSDTGAGKD
jgi:hypothetical protein